MERRGRADHAALPLHGADRAGQLDARRRDQRAAREVVPARTVPCRGRARPHAAAAAVGARRARDERRRHPGVPGRQRQPAAVPLHARLAEDGPVLEHGDRAAARGDRSRFDDRLLALRPLRAIAEPRVLREQRLPVHALRRPVADGRRDARPAVAAGARGVPDDARPHGRMDRVSGPARAGRAARRRRRAVGQQGPARDRRLARVAAARALALGAAARDRRAGRRRHRAHRVLGEGALAQRRRPGRRRRAHRADRLARGACRVRAAGQPGAQRGRADGDRPAAPRRPARRVRERRARVAAAGRPRAGAAGAGRQPARRRALRGRLRAVVCARVDGSGAASGRARRGRRGRGAVARARRVQRAAENRRASTGDVTDGAGYGEATGNAAGAARRRGTRAGGGDDVHGSRHGRARARRGHG
ncbi:hypothetical protein BCEP4_1830003 [Burkholderia cepacia]|nr:hypothetical protein BCEP4_1830003 [Burkholderia cepacia]